MDTLLSSSTVTSRYSECTGVKPEGMHFEFEYKQVRMHCGSGTVDRRASEQLADAAAYAGQTLRVHCPQQTAALFCVK